MTYPPQQPPGSWPEQNPYGPPDQQGPHPAGGGGTGQPPGRDELPYDEPYAQPVQYELAPEYNLAAPVPDYGPAGYGQVPDHDPAGYPPPGQPTGYAGYQPPVEPPPAKRSPVPWILAGGAVLLVVLLLVGGVLFFVLRGRGNTKQQAGGSASPSASASASGTGDRVANSDSTLSYARLGSPWQSLSMSGLKQFTGTPSGQQVQTQSSGRGYFAVVVIAQRDPGQFPYHGTADLQKTNSSLVTSILASYYPKNVKQDTKVADQSVTQDGHSGWAWAYHVTYSDPSIESTGETILISVFDVGGGKVGAFYASVPDNRKSDLLSGVKQAGQTLKIGS